jgi:hypothetical protein
MPDDDVTGLSDADLALAAGGASDDLAQRRIQAEMWRRTTVIARRANLIAATSGRLGPMVGLWAIEAALIGILVPVVSASDFTSTSTANGPVIALVLLVVVNTLALLSVSNGSTVARNRLRAFDAEQRRDV